MQKQIDSAALLAEILLPPSNTMMTQRFAADAHSDSQAPCSGICEGGACMSKLINS